MTTGRINQVAFTCTHGYLAILGKFNQLSGRLKPSIPSTNITGNQCKQQSHPLKVFACPLNEWGAAQWTINVCRAFTLGQRLGPESYKSQITSVPSTWIRKRKPSRLVTLFLYFAGRALISGTGVLPKQKSEVFLIKRGVPVLSLSDVFQCPRRSRTPRLGNRGHEKQWITLYSSRSPRTQWCRKHAVSNHFTDLPLQFSDCSLKRWVSIT